MKYTVISFLPIGFLGLSLGVTQDVLAVAGELARRHGVGDLDLWLASSNGEAVESFSGLQVQTHVSLEEMHAPDLLVVHPWWGEFDEQTQTQASIGAVIQDWHGQGTLIAAPTTASYFLAEAGLLDHKLCTTHWHKHDDFAQRFPMAQLSKNRHITVANGLYCSTGMQAGLEILIHVLGKWFGREHAAQLESIFMPDFKQDLSTEFLAMAEHYGHGDQSVLKCQQWLELNYDQSITVIDMAERVHMSERSFKRRFKLATGMSPLNYLQRLRVEQGKQYLLTSAMAIADVALRVGYEDAGHFIRLFEREYGDTPAQWRRKSHRLD